LLTGVPPFGIQAKSLKQLYRNINDVKYEWPKDLEVSASAKDLITKILVKKEASRITLQQISSHDFFKKNSIPKNLPLNFLTERPTSEWAAQYPVLHTP
jgi:serine/threonine protein kinase